jgi:uncharacterized integral membrane protein
MSADEAIGLHELVNTIYDESIRARLSLGIVVVTGLCYLPFLWCYRWRTSALFLLAAILVAGGAVGVEQISGGDINSLNYNMLAGLAEGMQMSGVILAIYTVLDFMGRDESPG